MGKVLDFSGITKHDTDPDRALENLKGKSGGFVIAGFDKEGNEFFASTYAEGGTALWLLKRCERALLNCGDGE